MDLKDKSGSWHPKRHTLTTFASSSLNPESFNMNRFILSLLPLAIAAPALAGNIEPVVIETAPAAVVVQTPVYNWSGAYIGAQANYVDVETDGDAELDDDGGLYGLRAGYDLQRGSQVFGALLQYDIGSVDLEDTGIELEDVLRVGGRYGFTSGPALYYGMLGYANAGTDDIGDADGAFVGIGYERFVAERVTLGAEVIYHDFNDFDDAGDLDIDATATTLGVNLNFRF